MLACSRRGRSSWRGHPPTSVATRRFAERTWDTEKHGMEALLHQILSGLANGGIYASIALALVMIYQATHLINFAQGELAMCSTYLAWAMINAGLPYWVAFFATVAISFGAGVLIER